MPTRGGESGSTAPVMMTGAGGESLEYKNPATEPPNWKGKTLYLTFRGNTSIRWIKAFEDLNTELEEEIIVVSKPVFQQLDMYNDCALPVGMGLFKFNKKVYFVGGEATSLKDPLIAVRFVDDPSRFCQSSDKVYEFDPSYLPNFREIPENRLPLPMPQPIVANLLGKVYVLHGDHISWRPGVPENPELAFQVLEFDSKSCHWETVPHPPCYDAASPYFGEWKMKTGVIGHRLFIFQACDGDTLHVFDARKQSWESGYGDDLWPFGQMPATTLSSLLTSSGPYHRKTKMTGIGQGKDCYFIAVGTECHFGRDDRVFAAVVDADGVMSDLQWLQDPLPAEFHPLVECKVIDLLEEDEQEDDEHLSSTLFCVVYVSGKGTLALSVFRVSLLSPMVVVRPTDRAPYLSRQDKAGEASDESGGGGDFLRVEILEKRYHSLGDACPRDLSDAFFL